MRRWPQDPPETWCGRPPGALLRALKRSFHMNKVHAGVRPRRSPTYRWYRFVPFVLNVVNHTPGIRTRACTSSRQIFTTPWRRSCCNGGTRRSGRLPLRRRAPRSRVLCSQRTQAMNIRRSVQLCYTLWTILLPNPAEDLTWAAHLVSSIVHADRFVVLG